MNGSNMLFSAILMVLTMTGCSNTTKNALVFHDLGGPTIRIREIKHGIYFGPCGITTKKIEWQVKFSFDHLENKYIVNKNTKFTSEGIKPLIKSGVIKMGKKRDYVDVNLLVGASSSLRHWNKNGRYFCEKY